MQRLTGPDALMLNMERPDTPMHTLKVAVLDTTVRGRAVTLDDLHDLLPHYLGHFPRATQRVEHVPGHGARPFWVHDENFCLAAHLDEVTLTGSGDTAALDALLSQLAVAQLDRSRPLWALTLVHGLAGDRQAAVVRVHHAVADGLAALNTLMQATSVKGGTVQRNPVGTAEPHDPKYLRRTVQRDGMRLVRNAPRMVGEFFRSVKAAHTFERRDLVPVPLESPRNSFSARSGGRRVCASAEVALADIQQIAVASGTTVNGALHGVIAGAIRAELIDRSEDLRNPSVTVFGVCADLTSQRTYGNDIATAAAYLRSDITDPIERLQATADSCAAAVERRRVLGFDTTDRIATYTGRLGPLFRTAAAPWVPRVVNNITTANMPGPRETRWIGDVEVVSWVSFALAIAPADVNLTTYSYAGRLSMGLITTPESMPRPDRFLVRIGEAITELQAALVARGMLAPPELSGDRR